MSTVSRNRTEIGKIMRIYKKRESLMVSPYDELEKVLFEWNMHARSCIVAINSTILRALEISSCLGVNDFSASNERINRLNKRHNLTSKSLFRKSGKIRIILKQLKNFSRIVVDR